MKSSKLAVAASAALALTTALIAAPAPPASATSNPEPYIIGGSDASEGDEFAIRTLSHYPGIGTARCTATLVNMRGRTGVVTNAHCVSDLMTGEAIPAANIEAQVGSIHLNDMTTVGVKRVVVHPEWDWATGSDRVADLAVMVLDTDLPLTAIRLGNKVSDHRRVQVFGWGKTTVDATQPPAVLQQFKTRLTSPDDCAGAGPIGVTEGEICIRPGQEGATICNGDSGGPVVGRTLNDVRMLLGGVSRGVDEPTCTGPAVATDFTFWSGWIIKALSGGLPYKPRHVAPGASLKFMSQVR